MVDLMPKLLLVFWERHTPLAVVSLLNYRNRSHLDLFYQLHLLLPNPWMRLLLGALYTDKIAVYYSSHLTLILISTRICEHALSSNKQHSQNDLNSGFTPSPFYPIITQGSVCMLAKGNGMYGVNICGRR